MNRAEEMEAEGLTSRARAYRQLIHNEDMRKTYRLMKITKPSKSSKSISEVQAPPLHHDIDGIEDDTETFSGKEDVERAFLQHLERRFSQAHQSIPLSDDTLEKLGLYGTTEEAMEILRGTYR